MESPDRDRFTRTATTGTDSEYFWALSGLTFEVRAGEALGVIGPNGAGKSTLLKILSRITEPTVGVARISHGPFPFRKLMEQLAADAAEAIA